ncbi:hypothetical protein [Roseibium sp.]|uniref:hypothetical protein n=1 Tax=Roseibium sp. TaxID=1936156 RepID=UPI003BAEC872
MPRPHPAHLHLVPPSSDSRGLENWATALKQLFRKKPAYGAIPHDLLADVLADNGLRAREEERQRPQISGLWS